jgi:hypothetical protein
LLYCRQEVKVSNYSIKMTRRPGNALRFDVYRGDDLVEGGFWSRAAAEEVRASYEEADAAEMKHRQAKDAADEMAIGRRGVGGEGRKQIR